MGTVRPFDQSGIGIAQLEALAAQLGREAFLAQHPHPFVVALARMEGVYTEEVTQVTSFRPGSGLAAILDGTRIIPPDVWAWAACKQHDTFPSRITIGRARSNDIAIPHASISKAHALLTEADGGWTLIDIGSSNGSRCNGQPVVAGAAPTSLTDEDVLHFGVAPEMIWIHPETLLDQFAKSSGGA